MPAISVIIPVYNTAPFLDQCLQSVTAQTFQDIEIICVDNSSTDNSADILHRWAERDKRIKLFQSQNFGPGSGRNKGLDKAQGEYVLFLDSDDFLDTKACETLYQAAKAEDLDVAMCDFYEYHHQTGRTAPRNKAYELSCTHYLDNTKGNTVLDFVQFAFAFPFMAFKLVRREILERLRLRFPYGAAEDVTVCVSLLASCRRVKMLEDQYLYFYRIGREGNISANNEKMALDGLKNFTILEDNLKKYGVWEEVKETFWFNKMVLLIGDEKLFAGRLGNISPQAVQKAYDLLRPELSALDLDLFKNRNWLFRWKAQGLCRAVAKNDLKFPCRLRKLRNILMIVLDPYYKLAGRH